MPIEELSFSVGKAASGDEVAASLWVVTLKEDDTADEFESKNTGGSSSRVCAVSVLPLGQRVSRTISR
jgi:hypothetical protein